MSCIAIYYYTLDPNLAEIGFANNDISKPLVYLTKGIIAILFCKILKTICLIIYYYINFESIIRINKFIIKLN